MGLTGSRSWPRRHPALRALSLERHVVDPLAQLGALSLHLVLRLVDASAKLAHLLLERVHARQQLRDKIAAAAGRRWVADGRDRSDCRHPCPTGPAASASGAAAPGSGSAGQSPRGSRPAPGPAASRGARGSPDQAHCQHAKQPAPWLAIQVRSPLAGRSFSLSSRRGPTLQPSHDARRGRPCGSRRTRKTGGLEAAGLRQTRPDQRTEVIVLRFCAHACSLSPSAVGRSLPKLIVLIRAPATPRATR